MAEHPAHPRRLETTGWTSAAGLFDYRHWEVERVDGDDAVLRAVLAPEVSLRVPWRQLRDRACWAPGWVPL